MCFLWGWIAAGPGGTEISINMPLAKKIYIFSHVLLQRKPQKWNKNFQKYSKNQICIYYISRKANLIFFNVAKWYFYCSYASMLSRKMGSKMAVCFLTLWSLRHSKLRLYSISLPDLEYEWQNKSSSSAWEYQVKCLLKLLSRPCLTSWWLCCNVSPTLSVNDWKE